MEWEADRLASTQQLAAELSEYQFLYKCLSKIHVCFHRFDYLHLVASKMPRFLL